MVTDQSVDGQLLLLAIQEKDNKLLNNLVDAWFVFEAESYVENSNHSITVETVEADSIKQIVDAIHLVKNLF